MPQFTHNSVKEAMNFSAALTEACSRSGPAGICTSLLNDALQSQPVDPRVMRLAELFTARMLGDNSTKLSNEIADLTLEIEAEQFIRQV
jgi:hypothetical protein